MNCSVRVKEELLGESCSRGGGGVLPRPVDGLHDAGPPPFLTKTYDLVEERNTNHIISWSSGNNSFVVWDPQAFALNILPRVFKHNNFSSFVRQLNTYVYVRTGDQQVEDAKQKIKDARSWDDDQQVEDAEQKFNDARPKRSVGRPRWLEEFDVPMGFRKVDADKWEFANEAFLRGQRHLLNNIRRRKNNQAQSSNQGLNPCVEVGRFGLDEEVDRLIRDKQVLMMELVRLKQQQQSTRVYLQSMEERLKGTEMKQKKMMTFLARLIQNPDFMQQLVQGKDRRKEIEDEITKKRRRNLEGPSDNQMHEQTGGSKNEHININCDPRGSEYTEISEFDISELDILAMDMQGLSGGHHVIEQEQEKREGHEKSLDQGFWEKVLNEKTSGDQWSLLCDEDGDGGQSLADQWDFKGLSQN